MATILSRAKVLRAMQAAALVTVLLIGLVAAQASIAGATYGVATTAIPFGASYSYSIVAHGGEPGFEAPSFDDSSWSTGNAPFGTTDGPCSFNNPANVQTIWPANTDLLLRKNFTLPSGAHNLQVAGTVDNDATVYLNGHEIGTVASGFCISPNIDFTAPDALLQTGENVLAVRGHDHGVATYLDLEVTFDAGDPATKNDCKDGGWADYGFSNQGQCIRFIEAGKVSRLGN